MSSPASRQERGKDGASTASSIPGAGWWTMARVEERLREAMDVMRRLPNPTMGLLRALDGERWPDSHVPESPENKPNPLNAVDFRTGGVELDEADEAIRWLLWLVVRTQKIVSGRAASSCSRSRYFATPQKQLRYDSAMDA